MPKEAFAALKKVLVAHCDGLRVTKDGAAGYELYTVGPIEIVGRKLPNVFFAAVKEGKNDTAALHFMPIHSHPRRFEDLSPKLKKKLTGKSCFHLKTADPELLDAVSAMLERGREIYLTGRTT